MLQGRTFRSLKSTGLHATCNVPPDSPRRHTIRSASAVAVQQEEYAPEWEAASQQHVQRDAQRPQVRLIGVLALKHLHADLGSTGSAAGATQSSRGTANLKVQRRILQHILEKYGGRHPHTVTRGARTSGAMKTGVPVRRASGRWMTAWVQPKSIAFSQPPATEPLAIAVSGSAWFCAQQATVSKLQQCARACLDPLPAHT